MKWTNSYRSFGLKTKRSTGLKTIEHKQTATILTCPAVDGPATVHDRMPLLVPAGMTSEWLDPSIDGARLLAPMRKAGAELSARLHFHEVAPPEGDGPSLIRPINREEPMRLF